MIESRKVSSTRSQGPKTGTVLKGAIAGIPQRFWGFTRQMAQMFTRHLSKDRAEELIDAASKDFRQGA